MAIFRSFRKFRAIVFVTEPTILKERCSATYGATLQRVFHTNPNLPHYASITSFSTHRHGRPASSASRAAVHHTTQDELLLAVCSGLRLGPSTSRCGFYSGSHPRCTTSTKLEKRDSGEDKLRTSRKEDISRVDASDESTGPNVTQDKDEDLKEEADNLEEVDDDEPIVAKYDEMGKPLSNWTRMKMMMKAYGYVIIPVHWMIAPVWFGAFYYVIKMGVDIGPFLLKIGISENHVKTLNNSTASNALMAYALYKIFTPLRYTVTVGSTEMTIRYLRRKGYIKLAPRKEKTYRESLKETVQGVKEKIRKDEK